nr:hypothetical protein [uncultured Undibacterium sp.]
MPITPELLQDLMQAMESEGPIDFAGLPFKQDELREIVASHVCELAMNMDSFNESERFFMLLAIVAKLNLENLVLHMQLQHDHHIPSKIAVKELMLKFRKAD